MKRPFLISIFVLWGVAAAGWGAPPKTGPFPELKFSPGVPERAVLKNGAVVYLLEDRELPLFSLNLMLKSSPTFLAPGTNGAYGILSQVWRSGGTQKWGSEELNELLEHNAVQIETSVDMESASVSLTCLSAQMSRGLDVFKEVLLRPRFERKQISLAKKQALETIKRKNETPGGIARRAVRDILYGKKHIYAAEATQRTLANIDRSTLRNLHRRLAVPEGAVISVAGDFDKEQLLKELDRLLGDWPPSGRAIENYDYGLKQPPSGEIFYVEKAFNQSRVLMGGIGISRHDPDHFVLEVAHYILGEGGTSRLFSQLRSKLGLAYMVGSFYTEPAGPGMVGVGGQTKAESTIQFVEAFRTELRKFTVEEPSPEEMSTAKDALLNSFIFRFSSPARIVSERAGLEFFGYPPDYLESYLPNLSAVKAGDVLGAAQKYFQPERLKILVVGDKSKFGGRLETLGAVTEIPLKEVD